MAFRFIISERIGDGKTCETAFRPAIIKVPGKDDFNAVEINNQYYLVRIDDSVALTTGDLVVSKVNIADILQKLGVTASFDTQKESLGEGIELFFKNHPKLANEKILVSGVSVTEIK